MLGGDPIVDGKRTLLPIHHLCLFKLGVPLGEMWYLHELATWLREHDRSRFLLTAPPLRLPGIVGLAAHADRDGLSEPSTAVDIVGTRRSRRPTTAARISNSFMPTAGVQQVARAACRGCSSRRTDRRRRRW